MDMLSFLFGAAVGCVCYPIIRVGVAWVVNKVSKNG